MPTPKSFMLSLSLLLSALLLGACGGKEDGEDTSGATDGGETTATVDGDGDGYPVGEDCDDDNPAVNPGAEETCNGRDDDCDGEIDSEAVDAQTWYPDLDDDGFGDISRSTRACEAEEGWLSVGGDCDDSDPTVHNGATEVRCDGVDNDCSSATAPKGGVMIGDTLHTDLGEALAAAVEGDELLLCEGVHTGGQVIGLPIHLRGLVGPEPVRIEGGGATVLYFPEGGAQISDLQIGGGEESSVCLKLRTTEEVTLSGVWIEGCTSTGLHFEPDSGTLLLQDVTISDNGGTGSSGSGLIVGDGGEVALEGVIIEGNKGGQYGPAGVDVHTGATVSADDSTRIRDNIDSAGFGGGVELNDAIWIGGRIEGNAAGGFGGGVVVYGDSFIFGAVIDGNSAAEGGGILIQSSASLHMEEGQVTRNSNYGADISGNGSLSSFGVDWGSGSSDNGTTDVHTEAGDYSFGSDANFTCTGSEGCTGG